MPEKSESEISKEIRDNLDKLGILNWRMNSGGYRGRSRGHKAGTADILCAPRLSLLKHPYLQIVPAFLWIETKKTEKDNPSEKQLEFAETVQSQGHLWICVYSWDQVHKFLALRRLYGS